MIQSVVMILFSPTRAVIDYLKIGNPEKKGDTLRKWSISLYIFELVGCGILFLFDFYLFAFHLSVIYFLLIYSYSRCNEISYAFYTDTISKLKGKAAGSNLLPSERIRMAMRSYVGLIVNFGLLYYFIPIENLFNSKFTHFFESIYFSVVTITTLGYGEFYPTHWLSRSLVIYQVLTGLMILVVTFAAYMSRMAEGEKS